MAGGNDPVLIKASIEGTRSLIDDLRRDLERDLVKIEDPAVRRVLISLKAETDLIYALVLTAIIPYLAELDRRIGDRK